MSELIVTVNQSPNISAIVSTLPSPQVVESLSLVGNVDTSQLANGSVLVYKTASSKWTSTLLLNQQSVDAGEF